MIQAGQKKIFTSIPSIQILRSTEKAVVESVWPLLRTIVEFVIGLGQISFISRWYKPLF